MCDMLYLGSNSKLPLIPSENWKGIDISSSSWVLKVKPLSIENLGENALPVRNKFKENYIVYAASYEGCGCGYNNCLVDPESGCDENEKMEIEASKRSRKSLYDYVVKYKVTSLYFCWAGDEKLPSSHEISFNPKHLLDNNFEIPDRTIMRVNIVVKRPNRAIAARKEPHREKGVPNKRGGKEH